MDFPPPAALTTDSHPYAGLSPFQLPLSSLTPASWTPSHSAPKPLAQALPLGRSKLRAVPFNPGTLSQKKVKNRAPPFYTSYNLRFDVIHEPPYFLKSTLFCSMVSNLQKN